MQGFLAHWRSMIYICCASNWKISLFGIMMDKARKQGGNAVLNVVIFWTSKLEKYTPYCIGNFGPTNQNFWLCPGGIEYYVTAFKLITFQWVKKYQTCQS